MPRTKVPSWLGFLNSAGFHLGMSLFWCLLLVPTLIWWKSSILWVLVISLYANFVGHWSAYQAARAEYRASGAGQPEDGGNGAPPAD